MLRTLVALDIALSTLAMYPTAVGDAALKDPIATRWSARVADYRAAGICLLWEVIGPLPDWVFDDRNRWTPTERLDMNRICPEGSRDFVGPPDRTIVKARRDALRRATREGRKS